MDQGPLVTEQIKAGNDLITKFQRYKPLQAAFWLKEGDVGHWYLHLASDQIDDSNFDLAYGEVIRLMGAGPHVWLDPFQVKVTGVEDPVAKEIIALQQRYPQPANPWVRSRLLGGRYVENAYLYPLPVVVGA